MIFEGSPIIMCGFGVIYATKFVNRLVIKKKASCYFRGQDQSLVSD